MLTFCNLLLITNNRRRIAVASTSKSRLKTAVLSIVT